ncbi:hypothetical protein AAFF_G00251500 [Aldrovandia affinis]|uniref:Uncharacterized protein n=1 Tax=Aldrovandia affinis TaxID=143900 RepID=A0AAD7RD11_9TELE|nr:hypothetical protein AAFF_G00251500 [Aldrovandia affinis]
MFGEATLCIQLSSGGECGTGQDSTAPPAAHTGPPPPCAQPVAKEQRLQQCRKPPKTAILMDSNGKFLNHRELFPRHSVGKFWCPHTDKALQLLCHTHLGDPDNIIIHTGTNDLRYKGEKVAEAVVKVAIKAHREFPRANITISTLLPWTDFPCDLINKINRKITTDCAMLTNVNIAHHPTLTHEHLYDHVHLDRDSVWIFTEDLRGATANREPSVPHLIKGPPQPHEARRHTPHQRRERRAQPTRTPPSFISLVPYDMGRSLGEDTDRTRAMWGMRRPTLSAVSGDCLKWRVSRPSSDAAIHCGVVYRSQSTDPLSRSKFITSNSL